MDAFNNMIDAVTRMRTKQCAQPIPTWQITRLPRVAIVKYDGGDHAPIHGMLTATTHENRYIGYVGKYLAVISFSAYGPYIAYKGESYLLRDIGGWMYDSI